MSDELLQGIDQEQEIAAPAESVVVEKVGEEEVEIVLTPSQPMPELDPKAKDYSHVDEQVTSRDIKKRISQLTARENILRQQNDILRQSLDRVSAAADVLAHQNRIRAAENHNTTRNAVAIASEKAKESLSHAKQQFADAVANGDAAKQTAAIELLTRAQQEAGLVEQISLDDSQAQAPEVEEYLRARQHAMQQAQAAQQPPAPSPLAVGWVQKNSSWFGKDPVLTGLSQAIDGRMTQEGHFDPNSPEYYQELNRRISLVAPDVFPQAAQQRPAAAQAPPGKQVFAPVAPASRAPGPEAQQRRRIVASEDDHRTAMAMGISVHDLLRAKADLERMRKN